MAITTLRIRVDGRWYTVQVGDLSHSPVQVSVEGQTYSVEVEGLHPELSPRPRKGRRRSSNIAGSPPKSRSGAPVLSDNILRSPMPGRVISVRVRPGDRVAAGDEVCVLEAMKMEQSIRATRDGVVKAVHVQPMDPVKANDPLVELE